MTELESRYRETLTKIAPHPGATLIAVSKTQTVDAIEALYRLGHRDFGENYVQELVSKAQELKQRGCAEIRWHFIGHLQSNKVKALIPYVFSVHTIDSEKLAHELAKRWREARRTGKLQVFIEVNIDGEKSKAGFTLESTPPAAKTIAALPELSLGGLMCIPAPGTEVQARTSFKKLRELEACCRPATHGSLSMGMSSDYLVALSEGATHIRVGTAIFGARNL